MKGFGFVMHWLIDEKEVYLEDSLTASGVTVLCP